MIGLPYCSEKKRMRHFGSDFCLMKHQKPDFTSKKGKWNLKFIPKEQQSIFVKKKCHKINFKLFLCRKLSLKKNKHIFDRLKKKRKIFFFYTEFFQKYIRTVVSNFYRYTLEKPPKNVIFLIFTKKFPILSVFHRFSLFYMRKQQFFL